VLGDKEKMTDLPHVGLKDYEMKGKGRGRYRGVEQHTFLRPEARRLLIAYLRYRQRRGETLTPDSPLFVTQHKVRGKYNPIITQSIIRVFERAEEHSGVKYRPHDMRRYGQTQLEQAGVNPNFIRKITGHKCSGEEAPYSRPSIEKLREAYRKALPHLIFIDRVVPISEEERRKQTIIDMVKMQYKDDPEMQTLKVKEIKNTLAKAKTMQEIDEALEEATK